METLEILKSTIGDPTVRSFFLKHRSERAEIIIAGFQTVAGQLCYSSVIAISLIVKGLCHFM